MLLGSNDFLACLFTTAMCRKQFSYHVLQMLSSTFCKINFCPGYYPISLIESWKARHSKTVACGCNWRLCKKWNEFFDTIIWITFSAWLFQWPLCTHKHDLIHRLQSLSATFSFLKLDKTTSFTNNDVKFIVILEEPILLVSKALHPIWQRTKVSHKKSHNIHNSRV